MSNRPQLNVRVSKSAKEKYEQEILDEYGFTESYAGFELEEELRYALGMGQEGEVYDTLRKLSKNPEKKNNSKEPDFTGEDTVVQYRVHPEVKSELKEATQGTTTTQKGFVESVMAHYILGEGYQDRMCDRIENLDEEAAKKDDDLSATERKGRDIAEYLKENHTDGVLIFEIEDFDTAAKENGLKTQSHARGGYLKDVLERLEVKPTRSGSFLPEDSDAKRDLRGLPYEAMDRSDMITVLRAELLERGERAVLTTDKEAGTSPVPTINPVDVLGKRPRELDSILTDVAEAPGFRFKPMDSGRFDSLSVRFVSTKAAKEDVNSDDKVLELAGLLENPEPETDGVQDPAGRDPAEANTQRAEVIGD